MNQTIHRAFTLIEILVSVTIIGVLSILIAQSFFTTLKTNTKTELLKEMKQNGDFAMQSIIRMIQNSQDVTCISTNELEVLDKFGNASTYTSYKDASLVCRIASQSAIKRYDLTSANITMNSVNGTCTDSLQFSCVEIGGVTSKVSIVFTLSQKGNPPAVSDKATITFSDGAVIRNRQ